KTVESCVYPADILAKCGDACLAELQDLFSQRYTQDDQEFTHTLSTPTLPPPCITNWWSMDRNFDSVAFTHLLMVVVWSSDGGSVAFTHLLMVVVWRSRRGADEVKATGVEGEAAGTTEMEVTFDTDLMVTMVTTSAKKMHENCITTGKRDNMDITGTDLQTADIGIYHMPQRSINSHTVILGYPAHPTAHVTNTLRNALSQQGTHITD
ncbi:hypothetical protein BaRGS_00035549, partial [Batillaria attramentaria]